MGGLEQTLTCLLSRIWKKLISHVGTFSLRQTQRPKCLLARPSAPLSVLPFEADATDDFLCVLPHSQCICPDTRQVWTCPKALCTHAHTHRQKEEETPSKTHK